MLYSKTCSLFSALKTELTKDCSLLSSELSAETTHLSPICPKTELNGLLFRVFNETISKIDSWFIDEMLETMMDHVTSESYSRLKQFCRHSDELSA